MPLYTFECTQCGEKSDEIAPMDAESTKIECKCGNDVGVRVDHFDINPPSVKYKGRWWTNSKSY